MNLSYWEKESWFNNVDFCIIGSGIVGLTCALHLKEKHPRAKILILEKGVLPQGASTKNAGFACFGSASELLSDLRHHSEEEVVSLVKQRVEGLRLLRTSLGDNAIDFQQNGGFELFRSKDASVFEECKNKLHYLNNLLQPVLNSPVFSVHPNSFGFQNCIPFLLKNAFEGQIDTGKMMRTLLTKVLSSGVLLLNATEVLSVESLTESVVIQLKNARFKVKHLFVATNAFASSLLDVDVSPARNQVFITQPIPNLPFKGTFHMDEGYFYFRNIHDRILLGGGRNLDKVGETTTSLATTEKIQQALETLLREVILPQQKIEIDLRWAGVLGIGEKKQPIIKPVANRIYCAVRLGGMGVAIGSHTGKQLANLVD